MFKLYSFLISVTNAIFQRAKGWWSAIHSKAKVDTEMPEIPGFWDEGPHERLPVEETWTEFVCSVSGDRISDLLSKSPDFDNADYLFKEEKVILELKEIETEFLHTQSARQGFYGLLEKLIEENPTWRPTLFGGDGAYPDWFRKEYIRLARPALTRILKKANKQLRETKKYFNLDDAHGILVFVNDGFTGLAPKLVHALACDALVHSYSSIDCFLYLTVNRYIEIEGSNTPSLLWMPAYSDKVPDTLVSFVNDLGRKWFDFLEEKVGPYTSKVEINDPTKVPGFKAIILPGEDRYSGT